VPGRQSFKASYDYSDLTIRAAVPQPIGEGNIGRKKMQFEGDALHSCERIGCPFLSLIRKLAKTLVQ
jgi:hypothetical protein